MSQIHVGLYLLKSMTRDQGGGYEKSQVKSTLLSSDLESSMRKQHEEGVGDRVGRNVGRI